MERPRPARLAGLAVAAALLSSFPGARPGFAQSSIDLMRIQPTAGVLAQGTFGTSTFYADFRDFGGQEVERTGGDVDVDPSLVAGLEGSYRLNSTFTLGASWLHSSGRYRVTFPALSRDPGEFDLEGFILAAQDFATPQIGGSRTEQAMSDAITDMFMATVTMETARMRRHFFPYFVLGAGIFRQVSDGPVFQFQYEGVPPPGLTTEEALGFSLERDIYGLPEIYVDETNILVNAGAGVRASLGKKWAFELRIEDLMRINPDLESMRGEVPRPSDDQEGGVFQQQLFAVSVEPSESQVIHNLGVRVAVGYAIWPFGAPR
jgi:hypothetical protein